jgi:hypothetical protein
MFLVFLKKKSKITEEYLPDKASADIVESINF